MLTLELHARTRDHREHLLTFRHLFHFGQGYKSDQTLHPSLGESNDSPVLSDDDASM